MAKSLKIPFDRIILNRDNTSFNPKEIWKFVTSWNSIDGLISYLDKDEDKTLFNDLRKFLYGRTEEELKNVAFNSVNIPNDFSENCAEECKTAILEILNKHGSIKTLYSLQDFTDFCESRGIEYYIIFKTEYIFINLYSEGFGGKLMMKAKYAIKDNVNEKDSDFVKYEIVEDTSEDE